MGKAGCHGPGRTILQERVRFLQDVQDLARILQMQDNARCRRGNLANFELNLARLILLASYLARML